ncbi:hypothetical protein PHYC_02833 [Phycisphaerales bacterium]|nr:hypothetical protein PHYC_02833 [Phycisphaerales bacterium]
MAIEHDFRPLDSFLSRVPGIGFISHDQDSDGTWWIKFSIDIKHALAWNVVQELGHVLNYLSLDERLPTVFMPVSPPPYLNGGPQDFLSWVIECDSPSFTPGLTTEWLEARLPRPVDDLTQWAHND